LSTFTTSKTIAICDLVCSRRSSRAPAAYNLLPYFNCPSIQQLLRCIVVAEPNFTVGSSYIHGFPGVRSYLNSSIFPCLLFSFLLYTIPHSNFLPYFAVFSFKFYFILLFDHPHIFFSFFFMGVLAFCLSFVLSLPQLTDTTTLSVLLQDEETSHPSDPSFKFDFSLSNPQTSLFFVVLCFSVFYGGCPTTTFFVHSSYVRLDSVRCGGVLDLSVPAYHRLPDCRFPRLVST